MQYTQRFYGTLTARPDRHDFPFAKNTIPLDFVSAGHTPTRLGRGGVGVGAEPGPVPAGALQIFRIPGAWVAGGFKILTKYGFDYCDRSFSMYDAAGRAVAKMQAGS